MTTIYIKDVPEGTTEGDVLQAVGGYGQVADGGVALPEGRSFSFVTFLTEEQAEAAAAAGSCNIAGTDCIVEMRTGSRRGLGPQVPEGTGTSLYVPDVSDSATEEAVREALSGYEVLGVDFRTRFAGQRYAFVELTSAEDVQSVLANGAAIQLEGQSVEVEERRSVARPQRVRGVRRNGGGEGRGGGGRLENPPVAENSVYVKGFPAETTEDEIKAAFADYGEIVSTIVRVKGDEDDVRTWAFVEYSEPSCVMAALEGIANAGGLVLCGESVTVEERKSTPKPFGSGGRRSNRRRGGGGSRRRAQDGDGGGMEEH